MGGERGETRGGNSNMGGVKKRVRQVGRKNKRGWNGGRRRKTTPTGGTLNQRKEGLNETCGWGRKVSEGETRVGKKMVVLSGGCAAVKQKSREYANPLTIGVGVQSRNFQWDRRSRQNWGGGTLVWTGHEALGSKGGVAKNLGGGKRGGSLGAFETQKKVDEGGARLEADRKKKKIKRQ